MPTKPEICTKEEFKEIQNEISFKHFVHVNSDSVSHREETKPVFFKKKKKKHSCKWLNEYELPKASFLRSFLRVTFSPQFISLEGSPVRLKNV